MEQQCHFPNCLCPKGKCPGRFAGKVATLAYAYGIDGEASAAERGACTHVRTHFDPKGWPTGEVLEICDDCGMSRTHWEQGESPWQMLDVEVERARYEDEMAALDRAAAGVAAVGSA